MRAMVLERQGPIETRPLVPRDVQIPKISGHEILVRVNACGVCHSDLHIAQGDVFKNLKLPLIPGHEVVGVVEEIGDGVSNVDHGDHVGIGWTYGSCMSCEKCVAGLENLCPKREGVGSTRNGGYAEYIGLDSRFVTKVPVKMDMTQAAPLFCAGLTAYRAVKRMSLRNSENVAVIGIGGLGSYAVQFAKMTGASVFAFSRNPDHLDLAERLGADEVIDSREDLVGDMKECGVDAALVFAPSGKVLEDALIGVGRGGRVLMAGNVENLTIDYRRALSGERTLTTVSVGTTADMRELIKLAADGKVSSDVSVMKLEEANEALMKMKTGESVGRTILRI